jgi:hypothetical protein
MSKHVSSLSSCLFPRQRAAITHHTAKRDASQALAPPSGATPRALQRVESRGLPGACTGTTQRYQLGHLDGPRAKARERHRLAASDGTRRAEYWLSSQHSQTSRRRRPKGPSKGLAERTRRSATTTPRLLTAINEQESVSFVNAACQAVCPKAARSDLYLRIDIRGRLAGGVARRSAVLVGWSRDRRGPARGADPRRVNTPLCRRPGGTRVVGRPVCINCLLFHDVKMGQQVAVPYH